MQTTLVAHEQPISRIFSNDYVFRIPDFQRPYAWGTDQARDLFEDLIGYMNARPSDVGEVPPYFLGSIVLIKSAESPNADVVDGQQRLTTLTLLLSAIRANVSPKDAGDITQLLYEKGSQILGTQDRFRLSLRARDQEFFQKYVQLEEGFAGLLELSNVQSDSCKNLRDNAVLFNKRLQPLAEAERARLAQFIVTRCYLVAVATPDLNSAYRIFSILNSRGLDLSATDILKAEIIGGVTQVKRDEYTHKWEDCEEALGRDAFGELFSHIRMVYRQAKPQGTLLKEFEDHVTKGISSVAFVDDILIPMADVYEEISTAEYSSPTHAEAVNTSLKWLNRLEYKDWVPPALAYAVRERNHPANMDRFFQDLERLAYGMLIMRSGINERIERFSKVTRAIQDGTDIWADTSPLQLSEQEQYFVYRVLEGPVYDTLIARARSTVLLRLDALMSGGGAQYDYGTVTVEHVLPQTPQPGSKWLIWFPEAAIRFSLVHKLGNLALLTRKKNSSASNYDFDRKKSAYFARNGISPFVLTTQVLSHNEWTPAVIEDRQTELLKRLEAHWRLGRRKDPLESLLD